MGIYSNGLIFGINIYIFNDDYNISNTLYKKEYSVIMNDEQKKEAYLFYNNLNNKNDIFFKIYTECNATYDTECEDFKMWYPISLNTFLEKFNV